MFVLARQFLKSDFKASLAVGLMFLCPWYLHHSHELRGYTSYLFFALVVFILLDRILKEDSLPKQPDVHIQISVPNEFSPLAKYNIGITAGIENTAPKPEWIEGLNRMDMNIVPSKFVKQVFESVTYEKMDENREQKVGDVKLQKPIEVLFEGADTEIYKKTKKFDKN